MSDVNYNRLSVLQKATIFNGLSFKEIELMAGSMRFCCFDSGEALVNEGKEGDELFIIIDGTVTVSVRSDNKDIELIRLSPGDFFGEMAMLEQETRSATCRAAEPTECFVLKSDDFSKLIVEEPKTAISILKNMLVTTSGRLLKTDSVASQIIRWGDDAKKRAITDEFTGLYNRRYLDESLEGLISRSVRNHSGVNFAMVDIDHFGTLNKNYGSVFCDDILLKIAEVFKQAFDSDDILIRYGGDEFCFIICGKFEKAEKQCKNVCINVNALRFEGKPELKVSCSIGLIPYENGMETASLLSLSDKALYKAKESGRNRVCSL